MQLSYDYAKDHALMCLCANYESHLRMSLALPGEDLLIMRQEALLLVPGRSLPLFGSLASLRTGAREGVMRVRNVCPDQNLSVRCKYPKNSDNK